MSLHWIGAVMIVGGCGGIGMAMAAAYRREELLLRQLLQILNWMECELSCRASALPQLFRDGAEHTLGILQELLFDMAAELERRVAPDAQCCMMTAVESHPMLPRSVKYILQLCGRSMGEFSLDGQLSQLSAVKLECGRILEEHTHNRDNRLRSFQVLGLCAGFALAILLF